MSVTVDTNVLVYASDTGSSRHRAATELVTRLATEPRLLTLLWPTVLGYLRIVTNPRILDRPLSPAAAMGNVDRLLALAHVRCLGEGDRFWHTYREAADAVVPRGNLVPDTHLVALMREHGVREIWTHDRDFRLFDGIVVRDPFG
ncbi:MAG: TA system VapC family ribonuclease toxin [Dermatophilaceae bacterium]